MKKLIDDKNYFGFVNDLDKADKRIPKYIEQFKKYGFDDTETWNLYITIVKFTLPRLKRFNEINPCHPSGVSFEKWKEIINKIIYAFELIREDNYEKCIKEFLKIEEGLKLFGEYFLHLWW